jgi:hypothetical protein
LQVQAGPNPAVPFDRAAGDYVAGLQGASLKGKRIAWAADWGGAYATEPGILDLCQAALAQMEAMGAIFEPIAPPFPADQMWQAWVTLRAMMNANSFRTLYADPAKRAQIKPETLWEIKAGQLKKSGLVSIHRGTESFQQLGGLDNLKAFCLRAMRRQSEGTVSNRPRGVLLLSPPGCGKSQFAKALGNETGRPTGVLDVGELLGSLVGQSESNVRAALKLADAMAPCVVFADELEKALAGATSSGQTDSGVTARVFGSLLTWLNDHDSDVFFVGTCNDASKLPPEFARA